MKISREGNLQVNVPFAIDYKIIEDFIYSKSKWIRAKISQHNRKLMVYAMSYQNGSKHWYLNNEYSLRLIVSTRSNIELRNTEMLVFHRKNASIKNILSTWYRNKALEYFNNRTQFFVQKFYFPNIKEIKIRNMKARWGSCSNQAVITYNVHLIKSSPENIDYVVIHELCHLIHPNHSAGFYRLQSELNPAWKNQKQSLNNQGYNYIPV